MFLRHITCVPAVLDDPEACVQIERFDRKELELASRTFAPIVDVHAERADRYYVADADHTESA